MTRVEVDDTFASEDFDKDARSCVFFWRWRIIKTSFFYRLASSFILWCDDKFLLSKLLYLHGIYYNVIGQDPNHDILFNITNILTKK